MIEFESAAGVEPGGVDGGRSVPFARKIKCTSTKALVLLLTFGMTFSTTPAQLWADGVEGIVEAAQEAGKSAGESGDASASTGAADTGKSAGEASSQAASREQAASGSSQFANASASSSASETLNGTDVSDGAAQAASSEQGSIQQGSASANDSADEAAAQADESGIALASDDFGMLSSVDVLDVYGNSLTEGDKTAKVGETVEVVAYYEDDDETVQALQEDDYECLGFQWYAGSTQSTNSSIPSSYVAINGATSRELKVTSDLVGKFLACRVTHGSEEYVTPSLKNAIEKSADAVDIYSAILAPAGSTSGSYVYTVDQTVQALAKEKGASSFIDSSKLTYQWQVSDTKDGAYADIANATEDTLSLAGYEGKCVKCVVASAFGDSTYTTRATNAIAAAGSVNVTTVALDATSKVQAGTRLTATAKVSGTDVTGNEKVVWAWYWGASSSSCTNRIEGAATNTFTPDAATYAGKYVQARANGGFGEQKSSAVAVVEAGSVELYGVSVSGAQTSGAVSVGATLTAKATKGNSYTYVESTDTVRYQWQYADSNTTSDANFKNIDGAADGATYTVADSMVGKYIRVIATSENSVKSTQSKSYYGSTTSVNPVGPVTLTGQYKLASVTPAEATKSTLTVGTTLTPSVKISGSSSWSTSDLPSDAKLTLTWYASDDGKTYAKLLDGVDASTGALTLTDSLVGKYIKVTACSLDNTVEWASAAAVTAAGTYDLLRVTASPQINSTTTSLLTGDTVTATAYAKRVDDSTTTGIDVTEGVAFAWYAVDDDGNTTLLEGLTDAKITVPESAAGKKLKVVATSGGSSVELVSANDVIAKDSLAGAVQQLKGANKSLSVAYSADGANINDLLKNQLADLGYTDIDVRVKSVKFSSADKNATVGISASDDDANGDVTFFFIDPNAYTGYNIDGLRRATVTFELSRDGETAEYAPSKTAEVAWDEAKLQSLLDDAAKSLSVGYSAGDSAESVTGKLTLPYRTGSAKKIAVSWESSDASAISVSGYGWSDYTGTVTRFATDRAVTLTATVKLVSGNDSLSGMAEFPVTVKADPAKVEAEKAELQSKLDAAFTYDAVTYSDTTTVADKQGLTADLQMPRPATIGVDGKYYSVAYTADTQDVAFNGYKGTVYQPLPGESAATVKLTCTVTDKSNAEISATKTLEYKIAPQDSEDLARELKLMEAAKAGYAAAILDGQDALAVTGNMHVFQKAYLNADGDLAWAYNTSDASAAGLGIVPVELDGYDDMGTQGWRLFKSSRPGVVCHESLVVAQPEYNTKVTVTSRLTSEKYARYAKRYPNNETYAKLAGQDVSAAFTVKGTTGAADPNEGKTITVNAKVTGVSASKADGTYIAQTVVPLTEVSLACDDDKTAEDILDDLMKKAGCTDLIVGAYGLTSATLPDGRVLATSNSAPWSYWSFFVNNGYASVGAPSYYVKDGDCIEFRYVKGDGTQQPTDDVETNPSADRTALDVQWNGYANGGAGATTSANTATVSTDAAWAKSLLTDAEVAAGASLSASTPLVIANKLYVVSGSTSYDPVTWAATSSLARLQVIDSSTGKVEKTVTLARAMDSTCRAVYADGLIIVPLAGGYLQALSASTLETVWVCDVVASGAQSVSSLTVHDGYVYAATVDSFDASYNASTGTLRRVNLATGAVAGSQTSAGTGYYWAGGVSVGSAFVIGDDSGTVTVWSADLSKKISSLKISDAGIRSSLVVDGGSVYAVSKDGVLHRLSVSSDGTVAETGKVSFAAASTSTPTISGGYAYVGGADNFKGVLAIIDLSTMNVSKVTSANGSALAAESKSTPLVSMRDGQTYVYFTLNGDVAGDYPNYTSGGGVYVYKVGDAEASLLFSPASGMANYCMASISCDAQGNLYYTNDSGHLFCIGAQASSKKDDPKKDDNKKDDSDKKNDPAVDSEDKKGGGNENGNGNKAAATKQISMLAGSGVNIALKSNTSASLTSALSGNASAKAALLSGFDSSDASSEGSDDEDDALLTARAAVENARELPIWPFVGIGVGAVVLALVFLQRKKEAE